MIRNKAVLNSDAINRYGFCFSISSLEDALEMKALEGVPMYLGHDKHRPIGWTIPFGLYFEPGMCRLVGNMIIAEADDEQKFINENHKSVIQNRYHEECNPHIDDFNKVIGIDLSKSASYIYTGCVCCCDEKIIERLFPKLYEKKDKDGLVYLSDLLDKFTYKGQGVFKDKKTELAVIVHQYFRKSLSIHNTVNHFLIDELVKQSKNKRINIRIALDWNMVGYAKTYHDVIELEYWRGPKFNDDLSKIQQGVCVHECDKFQKLYYGVSRTEFWWKNEDSKQTLEVEELKEHSSKGISLDDYGCRYVHSIYDEVSNSFEHFDGAIRLYDTVKMVTRTENDIKKAGKNSVYTKLFRVDGKLKIEDWKTLVCHYYQGNPLIHEYFGIDIEIEPHIINEKKKSAMEELIPYSMNKGDGIRLMVSYHPISENESVNDRYITGSDNLLFGGKNLRFIESDILEVRKALRRMGSNLDIPKNIEIASTEDLYWNIPTISHSLNENLQSNIVQTLESLQMIFEADVRRNNNKVAAFTLSWEGSGKKQITISVMGHCFDILKWLNKNKLIPIERDSFKKWLEKQSIFINNYPVKEDTPPLFEMVCSDGVLYIKRRVIQPDKYNLDYNNSKNLMAILELPKEDKGLVAACKNGDINIAASFIYKSLKCSKCKMDYFTCEHSKTLDGDVHVLVEKSELTNIVWTDRKA